MTHEERDGGVCGGLFFPGYLALCCRPGSSGSWSWNRVCREEDEQVGEHGAEGCVNGEGMESLGDVGDAGFIGGGVEDASAAGIRTLSATTGDGCTSVNAERSEGKKKREGERKEGEKKKKKKLICPTM